MKKRTNSTQKEWELYYKEAQKLETLLKRMEKNAKDLQELEQSGSSIKEEEKKVFKQAHAEMHRQLDRLETWRKELEQQSEKSHLN